MPLTITVIEAPTRTTTCGGARSKVRWNVQGSGYIIQHITIAGARVNCFTQRQMNLQGWNTPEYWECWRVVNGSIRYGGAGGPSTWSDCFEIPDQGRTRGSGTITGEVKFFPGYNPGNAFRHNRVPEAGILKATTTAPPGWDAAGALAHTLTSRWNCCRGAEEGSVTGTPDGPVEHAHKASGKAKRALDSLASMPKWSEAGAQGRGARHKIERAARQIAGMDLGAVRAAIKLYVKAAAAAEAGPAIAELSRIFVLNRYLFDVPSRAELGSVPFFGGWHGVHAGRNEINVLWPWRMKNGRKQLAGSFKGYSGPAYGALAEFDYFRRRFPRAKVTRRR